MRRPSGCDIDGDDASEQHETEKQPETQEDEQWRARLRNEKTDEKKKQEPEEDRDEATRKKTDKKRRRLGPLCDGLGDKRQCARAPAVVAAPSAVLGHRPRADERVARCEWRQGDKSGEKKMSAQQLPREDSVRPLSRTHRS